jgi:hypothetical protein
MTVGRWIVAAALLGAMLSPSLHAAETDLTPRPGTPLRKQVLEGLRQKVQRLHGLEVVFVVRHLKVKDGWAWVQVLPQSRGGAQQYEDVSALLRLRDGAWSVAETACAEVDNPDCVDGPEFGARLRARFPGVPQEILE